MQTPKETIPFPHSPHLLRPSFRCPANIIFWTPLIRRLLGPHPAINLGADFNEHSVRGGRGAGCSFLLAGPDTIGFSTEINGLIANAPFGAIRRCIVFPQSAVRAGLAKLHFWKVRENSFVKKGVGVEGHGRVILLISLKVNNNYSENSEGPFVLWLRPCLENSIQKQFAVSLAMPPSPTRLSLANATNVEKGGVTRKFSFLPLGSWGRYVGTIPFSMGLWGWFPGDGYSPGRQELGA